MHYNIRINDIKITKDYENTNRMKELEKKLKTLQKQGYEQINIGQVIQWIYDIKRENAARRIERRENER